ncbi:MAG: preprotein translocase subunit SecE [Rhizomicrobium sp.]
MADTTKRRRMRRARICRRRCVGAPIRWHSFGEVRREVSKVTWPSWKETWLTSAMVFIMVGLTMVFFFGVDALLAYGARSC